MPDITMCKGTNCPLKNTCYRHVATPSEYRQSFLLNPPWDNIKKECKNYWEVLPEDKNDA